jgi:hypothetical protein
VSYHHALLAANTTSSGRHEGASSKGMRFDASTSLASQHQFTKLRPGNESLSEEQDGCWKITRGLQRDSFLSMGNIKKSDG